MAACLACRVCLARRSADRRFIGSRSVEAPSLRTFNSFIPEALDEIVLRCVRKDALARPSCIEEVREVLTEVGKRYSNG